MFRYKENSRLMPCLEDISEGFCSRTIVFKGPKDDVATKDNFIEGKELILEYLDLEKKITIEEGKLSALKNRKNDLLNKIIHNSEINKLFFEMSKQENTCKTK